MITTDVRESSSPRRRCPWCHDEGDPTGKGWITCERDHTPVHAACIAEFKLCPICRVSLEKNASSPTPRIVLARSSGQIVVRPRIGGRRFGVEPLTREVDAMLDAIAREHRRRRRIRWSMIGESMAGVIVMAGVLSYCGLRPELVIGFIAISWLIVLWRELTTREPEPVFPEASLLLPRRASAEARAWAEEIAANDLKALMLAREFRVAAESAAETEDTLVSLERDRSIIYREALERSTPIEDAQRISGIGPSITSWLRGGGIATLRDLIERGATHVPGIKTKRAALLAEWARDRQDGLDRLVASDDFAGKDQIDRDVDARHAEYERAGAELGERAKAARSALIDLAAKRAQTRAQLDRELGA